MRDISNVDIVIENRSASSNALIRGNLLSRSMVRSFCDTRPLEKLQVCGRDFKTSIYSVSIFLYTSWNDHRLGRQTL